jgi:hypothetical protein
MSPRSLALAVVLFTLPARAHGLDANRVEVVLHEGIVEAVATPPAEFFRGADRNGDGLLDVPEVQARQAEILATLRDALRITDPDGRAGTRERDDVSVPIGDGPGPKEYVRYTVRLRWPQEPRALRVRCGFVGEHPVTVFATRAESRSSPGTLTLQGLGEYATLTRAEDTTAPLLGSPVAPTSPPGSPGGNALHTWAVAALIVGAAGGVILARRR